LNLSEAPETRKKVGGGGRRDTIRGSGRGFAGMAVFNHLSKVGRGVTFGGARGPRGKRDEGGKDWRALFRDL